MEGLENVEYKVRFSARNIEMNVFLFAKLDDDLVPVDVVNELWEEMKVDNLMRACGPLRKQLMLKCASATSISQSKISTRPG